MLKCITKKIFYCCFILLLCGCVDGAGFLTGKLLVYSDLDRVKNKTVYYDVTNSSIITARVNRQIEKALINKGWRFVSKDKAGYVYTVSTDVQEYVRTEYSAVSNEWGMYGHTQTHTYNFPYVIMVIRDKNKKENVYEGLIKLSEQYDYSDLSYVLEREKIQDKLFDDFDRSGTIACEFEYNSKTMQDEFNDCGLLVNLQSTESRNIITELFSSGAGD